MNFPTSADAEGFGHHLLAQSVADAIVRLRPELSERVTFIGDQAPRGLKVALDGGRNIVFARVADRHRVAWLIATPDADLIPVTDAPGAEPIARKVIAQYERFAR